MRKTFINTLLDIAKKDKRIFLLTGDLGYSFLEEFKQKFPTRFLNMGVAEQNMIGVAAGLALSEKIVFVYSIVPFVTMRCFEQIRNDLCHQNLRVRIIGVGGGVAYGPAGVTHHSIEDIAIMRSLVNMMVIVPADPIELMLAIRQTINHEGPIYIRLPKGGESIIHSKESFNIYKSSLLEKGNSITIIVTGTMLLTAKHVSDELKKHGVFTRLISMPVIKPLDEAAIRNSARLTKAIFSIEEHGLVGGLGTAVSEVLAEMGFNGIFKRFALPDTYNAFIGSQKYLLEEDGLSSDRIIRTILKRLGK